MVSRLDDATPCVGPPNPQRADQSTTHTLSPKSAHSARQDMGVGLTVHNHGGAHLNSVLEPALAQLQHTTDAMSARLERNTQAIDSFAQTVNSITQAVNSITQAINSNTRLQQRPSTSSLYITMPEYLKRAQAVFDALPDPPRPLPNVPLHTARDDLGHPLAPPAPRYLEHWSSFPQQLHHLWSQIDHLFGSEECIPTPLMVSNVQTDKLNEGNIDTWFKFHASQTAINILTATIARVRNQPYLDPHPLDFYPGSYNAQSLGATPAPVSPALASLRSAVKVVLASQIDSAAPKHPDGVDPYLWTPPPLTQYTLDMARAFPAASSSSVDESVFAEHMHHHELEDEAIRLKKHFFSAIRTDQELVMRTSRGDNPCVAIIEIKKPELFCSQHVLPALHDAANTWQSPSLRRKASEGKLPIRHALIHADRRRVCSPQAQYTFECIAQLWKYMAHKGLSYGMLSSVFVTLVLHIDWSQPDPAHSARFYCFEANDLKHADASDGANHERSFNLWHVLVAISIWNAQTGIADTSKIVALGAKLVSDYDSFTSDDESDSQDEDDSFDESNSDDAQHTHDTSDSRDSNGDNGDDSFGTHSSFSSCNSSLPVCLEQRVRDEAGSLGSCSEPVVGTAEGDNVPRTGVWSALSVPYASWLHADKVSRHTHPELFFGGQNARLNRLVRDFLRKPEPGYLWPASPHRMAKALSTFLWLIKTDASFNNATLLQAYMPKQVWAFDVLPCGAAEHARVLDHGALASTPDVGPKRRCRDADEGVASKRRRTKRTEVMQPQGVLTPPSSVEGDSPDRNRSA